MINKGYLIALSIMIISSFAFNDLKAQPDNILLNHPEVFKKRERPPVLFPHNRHMEGGLSCKDCHHQYKDGKNILDESTLQEGREGIRCSSCHDRRSRPNLSKAFHHQCIFCHKKYEKENKKAVPRFCGECHLWRQRLK